MSSDKKFKLNPKTEKLDIEIEQPGDVSFVKGKQKGFVPPTRRLDYLPRRRKKVGFINFYDLGQIKIEGVWTDKNYDLIYDYEIIRGLGSPENYEPAQIAAKELLNQPLTIDKDTWQNTFRKISYANSEKYRLAIKINNEDQKIIDFNNENWTAEGYKFSSLSKLKLIDATFPGKSVFYNLTKLTEGFDTDADGVKITNTPVFTDAAAALSLSSSKINIFINPNIFFFSADSFSNDSTQTVGEWEDEPISDGFWIVTSGSCPNCDTYTGFKYQSQKKITVINQSIKDKYLNYIYAATPKTYILDNEIPIRETLELLEIDLLNFEKNRTYARFFQREVASVSTSKQARISPIYGVPSHCYCGSLLETYDYIVYNTSEPPLTFPDRAFGSLYYKDLSLLSGTLVAVINSGNRWFYIWKD